MKRDRRWQGIVIIGVLALLGVIVEFRHRQPRPPQMPVVAPAVKPHPPNYIDPRGIVLHNSDSPSHYGKHQVDAAYLDAMHHHDHPRWATEFEGKIYHIGYHYVILPDGAIQKGRPDHCIGAHAHLHNDSLGICVVGAFATYSHPHWHPRRPTPQQMTSVISLCEKLMSEYHIPPEMVKRHKDYEDTSCPGARFPYFDIMKVLRAYASAHPETRSNALLVASHPKGISQVHAGQKGS